MPYSGYIGEMVLFSEQNAESINGVLVGTGQALFQIIGDAHIDVRIPETASWGPITFQRPDIVETFEISGTGAWETGAFNDLASVFAGGAYSAYCASGEAEYSNVHQAALICDILTVGATEAEAISKLSDVHGSGLCGSEEEGFTNGSYQISTTRVGEATATPDVGGSWVAFSVIEDTGNFYVKRAESLLTCTLGDQDTQTSYSFVPFPMITSIDPITGELGDSISVYGNAFSGLVGGGLGDQGITIQNLDNRSFSFPVPAGNFDHVISVTGQSGVFASSASKFSTPLAAEAFLEALVVFRIVAGQSKKITKDSVDTVNVAAQGASGLTAASLTHSEGDVYDIFSSSLFSYSDRHITVPVTGLNEGLHSLSVQTATESAGASDVIFIRDAPSFSYSSSTLWSSGIGNTGLYETQSEFSSSPLNTVDFILSGEADQFCLDFAYANITTGSVNYTLKKYTDTTFAPSPFYTAVGYGATSQAADTNAWTNFNNGQFATDGLGGTAPSVNQSLCSVTSSGTGAHSELKEFTVSGLFTGEFTGDMHADPFITGLKTGAWNLFDNYQTELTCSTGEFVISSGFLEAASASSGTGINTTGLTITAAISEADSIISSDYLEYTITGRTSGTSGESNSFDYSSGISFPFSHDLALNFGSEPWVNIWTSGMGELFPNGNVGEYSLTSGFSVTSDAPAAQGAIATSGKDLNEAFAALHNLASNFYWNCTTGNMLSFTTGETITPSYTGYFFGYCSGGGEYST